MEMQLRLITSVLSAGATFIAGLAIPVAFPLAPQWLGQVGLAISAVLAFVACSFWLWSQNRGELIGHAENRLTYNEHVKVLNDRLKAFNRGSREWSRITNALGTAKIEAASRAKHNRVQ